MKNDSIIKTFAVAALLCVVCSILVSVTATALKPRQERNALLDKQMNTLRAAGLIGPAEKVSPEKVTELFGRVEQVVVNLATGETTETDPAALDLTKQLKNPEQSSDIPANEDSAGIKRKPNETVVYMVKNAEGKIETVVLPIYGRGLWSMLYGFLALKGDLKTVANLTFYKQEETAGLGGEIANPAKMAKWSDKSAFDDGGKPAVHFKKGSVDPNSPEAPYEVDGLSGATLTCNGVNNAVAYWLGEHGFGPFLSKLGAEKN